MKLSSEIGIEKAGVTLKEVLQGLSNSRAVIGMDAAKSPEVSGSTTHKPLCSVLPPSFHDTYLLPSSSSTLEQFQPMDGFFDAIQNTAKYQWPWLSSSTCCCLCLIVLLQAKK